MDELESSCDERVRLTRDCCRQAPHPDAYTQDHICRLRCSPPARGCRQALQPVHYSWRTSEFPDRHFGTERAYGLIAQDVEKVLPELVPTDKDGYKAVDYGKLPLLTIQAMKELKTENDALRSETDALKVRVTELERLIDALLTPAKR